MSPAGTSAALQGYRLQALYTLGRVLAQGDGEWIFQPEGIEDLDILDNSDKLIELVQVKSYHSMQLSDLAPLSPEKSGSFFGRITSTLNTANPPAIKLVNFGKIGPELSRGWIAHGNERTSIMEKLAEAGYSQPQIGQILANVELVNLEEAKEEAKVYNLLSEVITGIDPAPAFELLQFWLFKCMERRERITFGDVAEKLQQIGRFLAERRDFHDQWFTSIQPLENRLITSDEYQNLQKEFYEGGFTRFEHILANLDFYREQKLSEIELGFETNNVILVHGASGQGKTTLAFRYLHDHFPNTWRFTIQRIENIQHALSISNALNGHAKTLQVPMAIFIDVHPQDTSWIELVKQLARHPYLQILVTIREEDFRRANIAGAEFNFVDVDLEFHEQEARLIYERVKASLSIPTRYLNFDDAWVAFGMSGPLLEFVYLLTQTMTLRQRLESQVNRIRNEVRERNLVPDELKLLVLAAVATAYETRLDIRKLINFLELPEPTLSLEFFEKEYLIRASNEGQFIEGLHSIRSSILTELLTSANLPSWQEAAVEVIPLIIEEDLESFLLQAFVDRPAIDHTALLKAISNFVPNKWVGIVGVLRSLLWIGVRNYVYMNKEVIEAANEEFGSGWFFFLDMNFAGNEGPKINKWWTDKVFSPFFSQERITKTEEIRAKQTPMEDVFTLAKNWLSTLKTSPLEPATIADWGGIAEVLYWTKRFEVSFKEDWVLNDTLDKAAQEITLPALADVVYALFFNDEQKYRNWLERNKEILQTRLAIEFNVIALQENGSLLTLHFIPVPRESEEGIKDLLHHETIQRLQLIRQLYPAYEKYGSQGYGHKLGLFELKFDTTQKSGVEKAHLVPDFVTRLNGIASGFARNQLRLETWDEYVAAILNIRQLVVTCLRQLLPGLAKFLERRNPVNVGADYINIADWQECMSLVNYPPDLPKVAVDQWGFASEISAKLLIDDGNQQRLVPSAISLRKYKQYLEIQRTYFSAVHNFVLQAVHVTATNFNLSKLPLQRNREGIIAELHKRGFKTDMAHLSSRNLWEARQSLFKYQQEFRQLFCDRVDSETLNTLDRHESELLEQLWQLWYFYAYEPQQILPRALHKVPQNVAVTWRKLDRELQRTVSEICTEGIKAELLHTDLKWESLPAKWIKLDVEHATELYVAFETLVMALQAFLSPIKFQDLAYYLVEENFPYIVIIPTIHGRMINENVWPLITASSVMKQTPLEEQNWVMYMPKPLPQESREKLEIELWDSPELGQANQFSAAVSALMLLASQISEFENIPDPEVAGFEVLQIHLAKHSEALSDSLQSFIDVGTILLDTFNSLSEEEIELHPHLHEAVLTLQEITDFIRPTEWSDEQQLTLSEIVKYAQRLSEVFLAAEYIRLLWIADIYDAPKIVLP